MGFRNWKCVFLGLLLLVVSLRNGVVEASRPFSMFPLELEKGFEGYNSEIFASMGIVCKCCDSVGGKCTTDFTTSCSNLHCSPWKQYSKN